MSKDPRIANLGDELIARAEKDPAFRRLLADDLEGTLRQATAEILSSKDPSELSDQELEAVVGGAGLESEAQYRTTESGSDNANDQMQQMMELIRQVREKLSDIEQSRADTFKGIARNT
ncbi:hypothetical protein [Cohnella thailandensis]|uniref:Uncharacterized protein n=1 Tax=Cohnella thailandensis TaxID=557557 RepID=A0A841T3F2_9BACL|nr:hypothetical protein [Cohnella thailandensis]MBB6637386.1 hypothetical protein [Cohnella thailandensis]MBP1976715.1 ABC-type transporter Mla subunit MlaD [Cohnella thailandensis]